MVYVNDSDEEQEEDEDKDTFYFYLSQLWIRIEQTFGLMTN